MAPDDMLGLKEELLAKEREISGMQQLLVEQDGDLRSYRHRLGELESNLLLAFTPSSASSVIGVETLSPHPPSPAPIHPVRRTLYENTHTTTVASAVVEEEEDAERGISTHAIPDTITNYGGDLVLPEEDEGSSSTFSQLLSLTPRNPPPPATTAKSTSPPGQREGRIPTKTPSHRHRTVSDGSVSPLQQGHHPRDQQIADTGESTVRLRQVEGIADVDATRNLLTAPLKEADAAPEPHSVLVRSPSAVPATAAEVHPASVFSSPSYPPAAFGGGRGAAGVAADLGGDGCAAAVAAATAPMSLLLSSTTTRRPSAPIGDVNQAKQCKPPVSSGGVCLGVGGGDEGSESVHEVDVYGRRLNRSFQEPHERETQPGKKNEEGCRIAAACGVTGRRGDDRSARNQGCHKSAGVGEDGIDRGARPELRTGEAEVPQRAAAATAVSEARAAKDEAERLRAEAVELSRWREAVLDLRDVLDSAQQRHGWVATSGDGMERKTDDDPVARHAKWVSCEALGVLLPRMQQSAKELLAELSAERARLGASPAAAAADVMPLKTIAPPTQSCSARIEDAQHTTRREYARPAAAEGGSLGEASRSGDSHEESQISRVPCERAREVEDQLRAPCSDAHVPRHVGEVRGTQVSATATARFEVAEEQTDDRQLASLRRECETSRIVVHALREKDEESQKRISTLEEELFQASLATVKQEALIASLRRRLESHVLPGAGGQRTSPLTPQRAGHAAKSAMCAASAADDLSRGPQDADPPRRDISERFSCLRNEIALPGKLSTPTPTPISTPLPRRDPRDNRKSKGVSPGRSCGLCGSASAPADSSAVPGQRWEDGYGSSGEIERERESHGHGRAACQPPTPTTDILRRLLYENSPRSTSSNAERSERKSRRGAADDDDDDDGGGFENAGRRSRHGRRLFAEGSTALRARPVDSDEVAGVRRGPGSLFSNLACEEDMVKATAVGDGCGARSCSRVVVVSEEGVNGNGKGKPSVSSGLKAAAAVEKPGSDAFTSRLATSEVVLRERLLQARKEFSALRTRAPID